MKYTKKHFNKSKKGFTLVELVVVIAILGILAAIAVPSVIGLVTSASDTGEKADASSLNEACKTYAVGVEAGTINASTKGNSTQANLPGDRATLPRRKNAAKTANVLNACEYAGLNSIKAQINNGDNRYVYDSEGNIYAASDRKDLTNYVTSATTMEDLYNM